MKSRYLNYFIPVLLLHILALFGRMFLVHESNHSSRPQQHTVLNTQININRQLLTPQKKVIPRPLLPKDLNLNQQAPSGPIQNSTPVASNGEEKIDIKKKYFADLKAHIEQHKHYPIMSRRLGQTGRVVVAFTLHEDGSFTNIHLHESCPFERLNFAALDAVKRVGKFRPIPEEINTAFLDIQVPIEYQSLN